jgi:hypothetical protein
MTFGLDNSYFVTESVMPIMVKQSLLMSGIDSASEILKTVNVMNMG